MSTRSFNKVRTLRQSGSFTKTELGWLVGRDRTRASRVEMGSKPTARMLLALELVFGEPGAQIFPRLYEQVEDTVMCRAASLYSSLGGKMDAKSMRKRQFLEAMMQRVIAREV